MRFELIVGLELMCPVYVRHEAGDQLDLVNAIQCNRYSKREEKAAAAPNPAVQALHFAALLLSSDAAATARAPSIEAQAKSASERSQT